MAASGAIDSASESESHEQDLLDQIEKLKRNLERTYGDSSLVKAAIDSSISSWNQNLNVVKTLLEALVEDPASLGEAERSLHTGARLSNNHHR